MKRLIIGIIIGLTLGVSTSAFAAVGDKVTAAFAEFKYVVNGEEKKLDAPVLVHEGNSYLRTTQIANMLGYDVTYKADSRTIEFDNRKASEPSATPEPTQTSTQSVTVTPTPLPVPSPTPSPTPTPTGEPTPTEPATLETEPTATTTPTIDVAVCQAIRDDYNGQIALLPYQGLTLGQQDYKRLQLEFARDKELTAAGCQ